MYELDLREEEYLCICYDTCTEEEIDKHVDENRPSPGDKKGETAEKVIKGILYGLIILTGVFGKIVLNIP